jgi:hypothetical protein
MLFDIDETQGLRIHCIQYSMSIPGDGVISGQDKCF